MRSFAALTLLFTLAGCGGAGPVGPRPESSALSRGHTGSPPTNSIERSCARRRPGEGPARIDGARQSSAVALARLAGRTVAYVADADEGAIHTLDIDRDVELGVTPIEGGPSALIVLADGRVAVSLRDAARVDVLEPAPAPVGPLERLCSVDVPEEPVALAASPDDTRLVVTSAWAGRVSVLDARDLSPLFAVGVPRDPRGVVVGADGRTAFVAHGVGARVSAVDLEAPTHDVHDIDLRLGDREKRPGTQGYAIVLTTLDAAGSPRLLVPRTTVRTGGTVISRGYGSVEVSPIEPFVSVIDPIAERSLGQSGLDLERHRRECLLPRAAAAVGDTLLVTCLGLDALVELDARAAQPAASERRRWQVPAGPIGLAVDPERRIAVVLSQFAHEVSTLDLGATATKADRRVALARRDTPRLVAEAARGRALFHATDDPRISRDGRACASCHPEGRDDALTWATPDGPRQTIFLAGRIAGSAPYGWFGAHGDLGVHLGHTFTRLGGSGFAAPRDKEDLAALVAWLRVMQGPARAAIGRAPSPLDAPADTALVDRGRRIFDDPSVGCAQCHGGGETDRERHDVGTGQAIEASLRFDTPSLRFLAGSGPYFHDGRHATLAELIEKGDGRMGHTAQLSADDRAALTAYLETL